MPIMVMAYIDPGTGSIILQTLLGSFFSWTDDDSVLLE